MENSQNAVNLNQPQGNTFNYHSLRAKQARLGAKLNKLPLKILAWLILISLISGGIAMLIFKISAGWILLGFSGWMVMLMTYAALVLIPVPNGKTEDIDDILSARALAALPENPNVPQIAEMIPKTRSGRFMLARFGLAPEIVSLVGNVLTVSPEEVFAKAKEIRRETGAEQVSGGMLMAALFLLFPNPDELLAQAKLEPADLYAVLTWYNYLHNLVRAAKKRRRDGGIARDFAFGYIPMLSRFGYNLSAAGGRTQVHQQESREIVAQMLQLFGSGGRQNVALIGAEGSGRTTIVKAFSERLMDADGGAPSSLKYRQVFMLDAGAIISAANANVTVEQLVNALLSEAFAAQNMIIYLDNAHLFFEEGVASVDISNLLIPILEAGRLRMILTMDEQKYLEISARKPALANALNKIMVSPASYEETLKIMEDQVPTFEAQHGVYYNFLALKEAYRLSERYIHDLVMPGRALRLLETAASYAENGVVTERSVGAAIEKTQGVRVQVAEASADREKLLNLEELIHQRMVDQREAVATVSNALRRAAAGVRNEKKPIGTFLFLGPTGVGKTELAKAISDVYFGGEGELIRIDLNEYVTAEDVSRLIADGASEENSLAASVSKHPFSVVLLDEIEKAHPLVLTTLLQVLDEGVLRDVKNREISFRDTIIVATSNAGALEIRKSAGEGSLIGREEMMNLLINSGEFKPEFLNRFDEICIFKPLSQEDLLQIVDIIMRSVNKTLAPQKIVVNLAPEAKALLAERGYDPQLGARPLRRVVQKSVENLVARKVLSGEVSAGAELNVSTSDLEAELGA